MESPELDDSREDSEEKYEAPSKMRISQPQSFVLKLGAVHMPEMVETKYAEKMQKPRFHMQGVQEESQMQVFLCVTKKRNFQDYYR